MTLRLYALRHHPTQRILPDLFFANRPAAKAERDRLNKTEPNAYRITHGPDHWRRAGVRVNG